MFSAFGMGPAACGRGLSDIDRVLFRVTKSRLRKLGSRGTAKYTDYKLNFIIKIEKSKLSVYFRRARTYQFSET